MLRLALATALILTAGPALAETAPCGPHEIVAGSLASEFHKAPVARMLSDRGFIIEVLATADGATFTILAINPDGVACLLATGKGYELVPAAAAGTAS